MRGEPPRRGDGDNTGGCDAERGGGARRTAAWRRGGADRGKCGGAGASRAPPWLEALRGAGPAGRQPEGPRYLAIGFMAIPSAIRLTPAIMR